MTSNAPLHLPQAPRPPVDPHSSQKPVVLPSQSGAPDTKYANGGHTGDDKSAVKNAQSQTAPITEQTLSNAHGIVPTLQYVR